MRAGLAAVLKLARSWPVSGHQGVSRPCTHAIHCRALMCRVVRRGRRQICIEFFSASARPQILQPVMDAAQLQR